MEEEKDIIVGIDLACNISLTILPLLLILAYELLKI